MVGGRTATVTRAPASDVVTLRTQEGTGGGRTATAGLTFQQHYQTSPFSDVVPGTGNPTTDELAQWKEGTLARYPCCGRVQPCGLIYCLFCGVKLCIRWTRVIDVKAKDVPSPAAPMDPHAEATRLLKAARSLVYGQVQGRSDTATFGRNLRDSLPYRNRWVNLTYAKVCEEASLG